MLKPFEGAGNGCHRLNLSNMLAAGLFDGFGHLSVQGAHLEQRRSSVWLVGSLWGRFCGWGSHAGEALAPVPGCSPPGPMYTGNYVKAQGTAHRLMRVLLMILY